MRCMRCQKVLSDPVSIDRGYGSVCWGIVQAWLDETSAYLPLSIGEHGFAFQRENGIAQTNVPVIVRYHSPTGFEWGYGGSGPADLALNIVEYALRRMGYEGARGKSRIFCMTWELHQEFKWQFIAPLPHVGGQIALDDVIAWLSGRVPRQMELL